MTLSEPQELSLDGEDWTVYRLPAGQGTSQRAWEQEPPEAASRRAVTVPGVLPSGNGDAVLEKRFHLPGELDGFCFHLRLEGLAGRGHLFLNGERIGNHYLPFAAAEWEVSQHLRAGAENHLLVVVEEAPGTSLALSLPGEPDALPAGLGIGLTEPVLLRATGPAWFRSAAVHTEVLPERGEAVLSVVSEFGAAREVRCIARVEITQEGLPATTIEDEIHLRPGETAMVQSGVISRVRLWHPNGCGAQPLYQARLTLLTDMEDLLDRRVVEFGVRQVETVPREGAPPDTLPYGLSVNGRRVWIQGWNWIPLGAYCPEPDPTAVYERLLGQARSAHVNLLRVWGGGGLEREAFYRLCDRYGIMVWQEFPLPLEPDGSLPASPEALGTLTAQAEGVLARRRNHPSLVAWSGVRGSIDPAAGEPPALAELRTSVELDDPQRLWIPSSPLAPHPEADPAHRGELRDAEGPWRFLGLREQPAFLNQIDPVLHSAFSAAADAAAVEAAFGEVGDAEQRRQAGELLQGMGLSYAVEADRRRMGRCAGVLPWRFNGPGAAAAIAETGTPREAYRAVERAYRPFHVSAAFETFAWEAQPEFRADVWLHNAGAECSLLNVVATVLDLAGRELYQENLAGEAPENRSECVGDLAWRFPRTFADAFFLRLEVIDEEGETIASNQYLHSRAPAPAFAPLLAAPAVLAKILGENQ